MAHLTREKISSAIKMLQTDPAAAAKAIRRLARRAPEIEGLLLCSLAAEKRGEMERDRDEKKREFLLAYVYKKSAAEVLATAMKKNDVAGVKEILRAINLFEEFEGADAGGSKLVIKQLTALSLGRSKWGEELAREFNGFVGFCTAIKAFIRERRLAMQN